MFFRLLRLILRATMGRDAPPARFDVDTDTDSDWSAIRALLGSSASTSSASVDSESTELEIEDAHTFTTATTAAGHTRRLPAPVGRVALRCQHGAIHVPCAPRADVPVPVSGAPFYAEWHEGGFARPASPSRTSS